MTRDSTQNLVDVGPLQSVNEMSVQTEVTMRDMEKTNESFRQLYQFQLEFM